MARNGRMRGKGLALGLALLVCGADLAVAAEKIVIGAMYPMTGRAGRYGIDSVSAAEIAMNEINAKGGVNGRMIDIIFNDSKANPAYSVKVAKRYITEDKVNFLMGVVSSAVGLAVTEVSKENKVIFVGTDHASTALTTEKFQPYYFRVSNNTYQSAAAAALYAKDKKDWKKYYVIGPDYEYGHRTWEDFWMLLGKKRTDVQLVGQAWPKLFEPDYTPYITAILNAKPDVLVTTFWGGDTVAFIKQALPHKLFDKMKFYNYDAGGNYELLEAMPTGLPGGAGPLRPAPPQLARHEAEQGVRRQFQGEDGAVPFLRGGRGLRGRLLHRGGRAPGGHGGRSRQAGRRDGETEVQAAGGPGGILLLHAADRPPDRPGAGDRRDGSQQELSSRDHDARQLEGLQGRGDHPLRGGDRSRPEGGQEVARGERRIFAPLRPARGGGGRTQSGKGRETPWTAA
ncbi:MAG TPA: ABC transporter substrate-binding protein [Candidatus Deferrimicrobiaceae bacterium]